MIHRPDLHWPAVAGSVVVVLAVAACVPASADSSGRSSTASASSAVTPGAATSSSSSSTTSAGSTTTATATKPAAKPAPKPAPKAPATVRPGTAVTTLATLAIKGRAPKTGYDRDLFGQRWADVDRNGCDTRNDVLRRDLTRIIVKAGTHGCLVLEGTLNDPYTGTRITFVRGQATSSAVQVDHVVALSDSWQKGAQHWSQSRRTAFANDPLNLLAVDGPTNLRKGDGDAATWLPPRRAVRCAYVARQVAVKHSYGLSVTPAERDAMVRVLTACPGQPLPRTVAIELGAGREQPAPAPTQPSAPKPSSSSTDPRFGTCREANAAGYGPYRAGSDPEYDWYQDRDHDGLVCER